MRKIIYWIILTISLFIGCSEDGKKVDSAGNPIVSAIASNSDMQNGRLYGYYKTDHFVSGGVDLGRGAFLIWSTSYVNWLSSTTYGLQVLNIANADRMW